MATLSRTAGRTSPPASASDAKDEVTGLAWIPWVVLGYVVLVLVVGGLTLAWMLSGPDPDAGSSARSFAAVVPGPAPVPSAAALVSEAPAPEAASDPVAAAKRIKPLEDIERGDRVLYQGHVCAWQLWNKNINTSTITCPGAKEFQIQTGRLTPIELRTGASKLTVEH